MRIGIDIDGVLTDIERWQLDTGSKYFSKYNKRVKNVNKYCMKDIFGVTEELQDRFWDEYLYDYAMIEPARKYAKEMIKKLKEEGNEIYLVTTRTYTASDTKEGQRMRGIVDLWLKQYDIYYDKIVYCIDDKVQPCKDNNIDVLIDDYDKNIMAVSSVIPVICYDAQYNKHCVGENIYRAYSWYDIYSQIHELEDNK